MLPTISVEQLKDGLRSLPGTVILTISAKTVPQMRKTDNPYWGRVHKISTVNGTIGSEFEQSVRKAELKEGGDGDFEAHRRRWGKYVDSCFIEDKGNFFLRMQEKSRKEVWYLDGKRTGGAKFEAFRPPRPARDEQVKYRNFGLPRGDGFGILSITWGGRTYQIVPAAAEPIAT